LHLALKKTKNKLWWLMKNNGICFYVKAYWAQISVFIIYFKTDRLSDYMNVLKPIRYLDTTFETLLIIFTATIHIKIFQTQLHRVCIVSRKGDMIVKDSFFFTSTNVRSNSNWQLKKIKKIFIFLLFGSFHYFCVRGDGGDFWKEGLNENK